MANGLNAADARAQIYRRGEPIQWFAGEKDRYYNPAINYYQRGMSPGGSKDGVIYVEQPISNALYGLWAVTRDMQEDASGGILPVGSATLTVMPNECPIGILDRIVRKAGSGQSSNAMQRVTTIPLPNWQTVGGTAPAPTLTGPLSLGVYTTTGAGTSGCNSTFTENGIQASKPYYTDGTNYSFWDAVTKSWYLGPSLGTTGSSYYSNPSISLVMPLSGWVPVNGSSPGPTATSNSIAAYRVSGAGSSDYNGYYLLQPTLSSGYPYYQLSEGHYLYGVMVNSQVAWYLGSILGQTTPVYSLSGAGTTLYDGDYNQLSEFDGKLSYDNGRAYGYWLTSTQQWNLSTSLGSESVDYTNASTSATFPTSGWVVASGTSPAPVVTVIEPAYMNALVLDPLSIYGAKSIDVVNQGTTTFTRGTDYALNGNSIQWLPGGSQPLENSTYAVRFTYAPVYQWTGISDQAPWADSDGNLMPHRMVMRLLTYDAPNAQD